MSDSANPGTGRRERVGSWGLLTRLTALVAGVGLLLGVAGAVVGFALYRLVDVQSEQVDHIDPADIALIDLIGQLLNQETGIRGYALDNDPTFLQPYTDGMANEQRDLGRLRVYLTGKPSQLAMADALEQAAQIWRHNYAEPVRLGGGRSGALAARGGKADFDRIRARYDDLHNVIAAERRVNRTKLSHAETELVVAIAVASAILVATAVALLIALRRWVIQPLTRLGADVRQVSSGDLSHEIEPNGPHETAEVGQDVETMRVRLVGDLHELAVTQLALEQTAAELERRAADLQRSNTDLEQFAYVASHDLQEPLRKVASFTQLLQERYSGQLDERADVYINFAVDGAKRMQRLIDDLLSFSRVGRSAARFSDVDLDATLLQVQDTLSSTIANAGAEIVSHGLPVVNGEPALLAQLLQNLLGNAVKFRAPDRTPKVEFGGRLEDGYWHLWCRDNGIGIDPQYADKVFVIFQRLHGRDEYAGTGIGLALCKKIVEFHGGQIRIDPELPEGADATTTSGTTVSWTLPANLPATTDVRGALPPARATSSVPQEVSR